MSIEYLEIRNQNFEIAGIVDVFKSVIWHVEYYGVGDFEIYAPVSPVNLALLVEDNYITRPNDDDIGVIESVEYTFNANDGRMIVAAGRFAKSILDRRLASNIQGFAGGYYRPYPYILSGNVVGNCMLLVSNCAIDATLSDRNISQLVLGARYESYKEIVDDNGDPTSIQVLNENLLTWTDEFLKKYGLAAHVKLNANNKLEYTVYEGKNRAVDNTDNNAPVIFSQDFENLVSSDFKANKAIYKNQIVVGGESANEYRFYSISEPTETGIERRETFFDASKTSRKYISGGTETTMSESDYKKTLAAIGSQKLAELANYYTFDGEINLNSLTFVYKSNYDIGDIVTIQDSDTKIFSNVRILEITEVQDENGYTLTGKYESV